MRAALGDVGAWGGSRGRCAPCRAPLQPQRARAVGELCETSWVTCPDGNQSPATKVLLLLAAGRAGGMLRRCCGVVVAVWLSVLNLE